ncbi:CmpA/NrtA family ABC transporter substrate-binding protein [Halalkalibacterium ligniniphilum]|uniref:CmpA/NrtA family ABC transporter substrate-binding protein n=1 Tax=Halalkalibacterium ligniniphilum TaxID=1134413 RepID=UPI00034B0198|nr:CmpA/NrtA family ABC transporter substrate-binding protein [Halalkalibacterium ligniniphilum]
MKEKNVEHEHDHNHDCSLHGCNHEHQYIDEPIKNANQLNQYRTDLKDLGIMNAMKYSRPVTRRSFVKTAALGIGVLASSGLLSTLTGCFSEPSSSSGSSITLADVEKPQLKIGFVPITCATPIIMADPMGFYEKHGLEVTIQKYGGWADIRDAFITGEIDAAHLLSPMTISMSLGLGSATVPTRLAAIENINGQAITLANKHKDTVKEISDLKGMAFGVPFDYSIHNLLLRHYLSEGGLDPDNDVDIRITRPPDMVANLASGNLDGYLGPEPFNQRAVHEGFGYIFALTKDLWANHPCCAFGVKQEFIDQYPKTYHALLSSIVDATNYSSESANRADIATAISPNQYLNQPEEVVKQVLTGKFPDGLGNTLNDPTRVDFDPYPWKSFAAWILTQMIRWDYITPAQAEGLDIKKVADEIFLTEDVRNIANELGISAPTDEYKIEQIMGKDFNAEDMNNLREWMIR